jgi:hypothetical protein
MKTIQYVWYYAPGETFAARALATELLGLLLSVP